MSLLKVRDVHLVNTRLGHFRRVLVGVGVRSLPSEHRSYETRWIPPTLVNVSVGRTEQVIYRIAPRRKRSDPSRWDPASLR